MGLFGNLARGIVKGISDSLNEDSDNVVALLDAASLGKNDTVKKLIADGVDIDSQNNNGMTALMGAVTANQSNVVKILLESGADTDLQNNNGGTALMIAAGNGNNTLVKMLINAGADLQAGKDATALMGATLKGHIDTVKILLDVGADTDIQGIDDYTALIVAAQLGHTEIVKLLLDAGADTDLQDVNGDTALDFAEKNGHTEIANMLRDASNEEEVDDDCDTDDYEDDEDTDENDDIDSMEAILHAAIKSKNALQHLLDTGVDIDSQNIGGMTALMAAVSGGNADIVKRVLDAGANIDLQNDDGMTALMDAAYNGHTEIIKILIDASADIDLQKSDGTTALMLAVISENGDIVKMLLDAGADTDLQINAGDNTDLQDCDGYTALMVAVVKENDDIVKMLLDTGADTDLQNDDGYTALMLAAYKGHRDIVKILIDAGTDTDLQGCDGSALMLAVASENSDIVKMLLDAGADTDLQINAGGNTDLQDYDGYTALMAAVVNENGDIVKMLLDAGADIDLQNDDGYTALMLAVISENSDIVKMLLDAGADTDLQINAGGNTDLQDYDGMTALMLAVIIENSDIVKLLLYAGADTDLQTVYGRTALMRAVISENSDIVKMLLDAGADTNLQITAGDNTDLQDYDGCTALDIAEKLGHTEIANMLRDASNDEDDYEDDEDTDENDDIDDVKSTLAAVSEGKNTSQYLVDTCVDLSNNPVAMFIKENLPNGNYKTYFTPDISDEIMANALTFILHGNGNAPIEINSSHVVAVCVADESAKGLNALVFTHEALYPKFDVSYRKINYEKIVSISQEGSDGLKIEYEDEKIIYIPENFSTDEFAQFLIKLSDYKREKQDDLLQEIINTGDFSLAKDITSFPVDKLLSYRDKYGNDILMLSILYDIPDVYNYILNNINTHLEKGDYNKVDKTVVDILTKDNEFTSSYDHKNNFDHSFLHFAAKAGKRKTIVECYYTYNHFSLLSYEEKNKIDEIISRSSRNIKVDKAKSVANTIGNGIFDLFLRPAFTERLESEKELDKIKDEVKLQERYSSCASQIEQQKNNFKKNFFSNYTKYNDRLNEEISKLNKQIKDIISDCETRITQLNKQKEKERNRLGQEITKFKNSVIKKLNVPKGEFETTAQYQERMKKLEEIKNSFETRFADELQNITETVQQEVEWNIRQIDDELKQLKERKLQVETNAGEYYETAHIVRSIKEKESEMEYYSFITNAQKKSEQQTNTVDEKKESFTTSMIKPTFHKSKKFSSVKLGQYNADEEFFAISIDGEEHILRIPISIAPDFKQSFKAKQIVSDFEIENAHIVERIVAIYDECKYPID